MNKHEIVKDNMICKNPMGHTLRDGKRYIYSDQPREESIFKLSKVKKAGLPEEVKPSKVFDFKYYEGKTPKVKEIKKPKKDVRFDVKQDLKKNKPTLKNLN